jgi:hypothetical protein
MYSEASPYASIWSKYRPVILKLMLDSEKDPQQYKLFGHEFKAMGQREKSGYSFLLEVSNGKALNSIKTSTVAQDLLRMLQQSQKASELMRESVYEVSMDKQFVLHVTRRVKVVQEAVVAE